LNNQENTEVGFAGLNGASFKYEVQGGGPALVLLHAGIADMRMWDSQIDAFAKHFQVVRYDMSGFGETAPVDGAFSHRSDLSALLSHLGIPSAHLLGCSMGGKTAIDFAIEYPEKVRSLVSVGASPGGLEFEGEPSAAWKEAVQAFKAGDLERTSEWEVVVWVDGPHRSPGEVDPAVRQLVYEMNLIALKNEAKELGEEQAMDPPAINRLEQVRSRVQIIVGDLDDPEILQAAEIVAAGIPGTKITTIEGTAHLPNMEEPERFNQIVVEFLSDLEKEV